MRRTVTRRRKKVSATLPPELIKQVEEYQREAGLDSFSAALEDLLWRHQLDERTKAYYLNMTEEEREEQRRWVDFASAQAGKTLGRD